VQKLVTSPGRTREPHHRDLVARLDHKVNLSHVFAGQNVDVAQVGERIWLVTFMRYDLGYFDDETCRLEPIENPFAPKLLPMSPE
jgi:putative transposase